MRKPTASIVVFPVLLLTGSAFGSTSFSTANLSCSASPACIGGTYFDQSNGQGGVLFSTSSAFQTIVSQGSNANVNYTYDLTLTAQGVASGTNTLANTLIPFDYSVFATVSPSGQAAVRLVGYQIDFNIQTSPLLQSVFSSPVTTGVVSFAGSTLSASPTGWLSQLTTAAIQAGNTYLLTAHVRFIYNVTTTNSGGAALFSLTASQLDIQGTPEPATMGLMIVGLASLVLLARRKK